MEKTCLELNQDILRIIYLNFIKKNVRSKGKALINENRYFINSMGILPLYENMDLQKSINLVTKTEKFIEMLTGSLKTVNDIKNHFLSQFFSMFFKKLYINTIEKFKLLKGYIL